jgi:hypothetical protein
VLLSLVLATVAGSIEALPSADPGTRVVAAHAGGVLLGMRLGGGLLWPDDYGPRALGDAPVHLREAVSRPPVFRRDRSLLESDGDPWTINVVGHGLFGSEIYLRSRQCGGSPLTAFAWTAGASIAWEYALEGAVKRPSAIDLAWTPIVGGLVLGELRFRAYRALRSEDPGSLRRIARGLLDPLGSLERASGAGC